MTVVIVNPRGKHSPRYGARITRHFLLSHRQIQSRPTVAGREKGGGVVRLQRRVNVTLDKLRSVLHEAASRGPRRG